MCRLDRRPPVGNGSGDDIGEETGSGRRRPGKDKFPARVRTDMASDGDPRVLLVMNVALSVAFSAVVVRGLAFIDVLSFSWEIVALGASALVVLTYLVVLR